MDMSHPLIEKQQVEVLDLVDKLRDLGIQHEMPLPQLIVCGDQSSGKSSLLEGISRIKFPISDGQCTRFPIEVVLRRASQPSSSVKIDPGKSASEDLQARFRGYSQQLQERLGTSEGSSAASPDIVSMISEAIKFMNLEGLQGLTEHVLRVGFSGPQQPNLTLVDLPGLIRSVPDTQSGDQVTMIDCLVRKYMSDEQSIILAVVSAKNDIENQGVLQMAREYDPDGVRTLAVITKPDCAGRGAQSRVLSYARNEQKFFRLGWHVVRNLDTENGPSSEMDRDAEEAVFFRSTPWSTLPAKDVGIAALIARLSNCLYRHICKTIPDLIREIKAKLDSCKVELDRMGEARETPMQQRQHLIQVASKISAAVQTALYGHSAYKSSADLTDDLRARIRQFHDAFAVAVQNYGRTYQLDCPHNVNYMVSQEMLQHQELQKHLRLLNMEDYVAPKRPRARRS